MSHQGPIAEPLWFEALADGVARPPLVGDATADVVILGAGYTGLWTAYYLAVADPGRRIVVLEAETAGFGASGRNGGWCSAHIAGIDAWLEGRDAARAAALQRGVFDAVDEVGRVAGAEAIACDYAKGGMLVVAANQAECARGREEVDWWRAQGFGEEDYAWLEPEACNTHVRIAGALGGVWTPHAAAVHPAKLARGLARAVERRGVVIHERTRATSFGAGGVTTGEGRLRAPVVLCCTEGFTCQLAGQARTILPLHSMMIATEPLPDATWQQIGAEGRVVFGDLRRIVSYGQRTADGRLAIGARGNYFYGSGVRTRFEADTPDFALVRRVMLDFFPFLEGVAITHHWGGPLGITRDWKPFVRFDPASGLGGAGGYVGSGVAASNLAGRTLADLVDGRATERVDHPWVQHRSRPWEPEPLRWLAVGAVRRMGDAADRADREGRSRPLSAAIFEWLARN